MKYIGSKSVVLVVLLLTGIFMLLFFNYHSKIDLQAAEKNDYIHLSFKSNKKIKNIEQFSGSGIPIPYDVKIIAYDEQMNPVKAKHNFSMGFQSEDFIEEIEYHLSGNVDLDKSEINYFVYGSYDLKGVKFIKVYWGVTDQFFPIRCEWYNGQVGKCVEEEKEGVRVF